MNILWTVNTLSPQVAEAVGIRSAHAIPWVESMGMELKQKQKLAIAAPGTGKELKKLEHEGITYYILPEDCLKTNYWDEIITDFKPDIIHAYGTEKRHNVMLIENYRRRIPIVISLQGIIGAYRNYYFGALPLKDILLNYTIGNFLLGNGIISGRRKFRIQEKYEKLMLQGVRYVEGRSDWDRAVSLDINPNLKYYTCPRMIRSAFFNHTWTQENCEPHSILVHQAQSPIKGLHIMLDALAKVRKHYPNVKLYVAGDNKTIRNTLKKKLGKSGYTQIIEKKLTKLELWDCVEFTGKLNADEMAAKLASVNVCVIPSSIENAPNALAEAMITGTPCVASYVGGNADMLNQGECGWLYRYDAPELLADRICHVFKDSQECAEKSRHAQTVARRRHDPADLIEKIQRIYMEIINDFYT